MNPRYAQTFMRHPRAFLAPVLLSAVISVWVVLGAGDMYRSTTNLWFDNSAPGQSPLAQPDGVVRPPAAQQQLLLNELLTTRRFRLDVGRRGPLAKYLHRHSANGWGPFTIASRLRGVPALDDRIVSALSTKHVIATISGPQVLAVSLDAPDPIVAAGTLRALVQEFVRENSLLRVETGRRALADYQRQVDLAAAAVAKARVRVNDYVRSHPNAPFNDPRLVALRRAETAASAQLRNTTVSLNQLAGDRPSAAAETTTFRVIDSPRVPRSPNGKHKMILFALIAGLLVGLGVSVLAVVASTRFDGLAKLIERTGVAARQQEPATAKTVDEAEAVVGASFQTGTAPSSDRPDSRPTLAPPPAALWDVPVLWDDAPRSMLVDAEDEELVKVDGAATRRDIVPAGELIEVAGPAERQRRGLVSPVASAEAAGVDPGEPDRPTVGVEHESEPENDAVTDSLALPTPDPSSLQPEEVRADENATNPANFAGKLLTVPEGGGEEAETDAAQGNGKSPLPEAELVGTIVQVRDEGAGRKTRPVWTIQTRSDNGAPVEQGVRVSLSGLRSRQGVVRGGREGADGVVFVDVEITALKRPVKGETGLLAIPPASDAWIGSEVSFVQQRSLRATRGSSGAVPGTTQLPLGDRPTRSVVIPRV
jgi:hypothetical protein